MKTVKRVALVVLALLLWTVFIGYGFIDGFLLRPISSEKTSAAFIEASKKKISEEFVGNFAMTLIEDGKVSEDFFFSIGEVVDKKSVYQVASISKWISSWGILKLVEQGKLDLDEPIDTYLSRWHLPESDFDHSKVTIRRLLSHSSGLIDDLGYDGFAPNEKVQTIEESLIKASDSSYSEGVAAIGFEPGSKYMYSGAGYTILQLIIEEVSGQSFQEYMTETVFKPLGMEHSTFVLSDKPELKLVELFQEDKSIAAPLKFTALAAASLYTCTEDLSKFLLANISNNKVLSKETIATMSLPETFINGIGIYGMGPHLYSQNDKNSKIIGHDGSGASLNTAARIDLKSKSGIIILERGHQNLASSIADEWLFWKAGIADYVVMQRNKSYLLTLWLAGILLIGLASIFILRKRR